MVLPDLSHYRTAVWRVWIKASLGVLAGFAFLVLAETVLIRKPFVGSHFQPELFWSWKQWNIQKNQIFTNVIMFILVGLIAGWLWRWLWFAADLSLLIEVLQLVTQRGLLEFDDVIYNCLGAVVGTGIVMLIRKISRVEEIK